MDERCENRGKLGIGIKLDRKQDKLRKVCEGRIMENRKMEIKKKESSSTAEEMAVHRAFESLKPENQRVCYDPYAIHFLSPETTRFIELLADGSQVAQAKMDEMNDLFPGTQNSIIARVRFFDDFVMSAAGDGIQQLVILGAGYDSRAYRIGELEDVQVFEVDHPATQKVKVEKVKEIFGKLPPHVTYVPVDIGNDDLAQALFEQGYDNSRKTAFTMEGFIYYFPENLVDELLSFMVQNSGKGSSLIFDYFPACVVDGNCELEVGRLIHHRVKQYGEPIQFGINPEDVETFLSQRGFSQINNVSSANYKKTYFHGTNANREVCSVYSFAHAMIE